MSTRPLSNFVGLAAQIGADPHDSDEVRLHKSLLVLGALMFIAAGLGWGVMYFAFDEVWAGLIPFGYGLVSILSVALFATTRNYRFFRFSQLLLILLLPFLLMMAL